MPEANFSTPESLDCVEKSPLETLVEETGSNVKESVVGKDVLEEDVDVALKMFNTGSNVFRAVDLMLSALLAILFTDSHRQVCLKHPDVHTPARGSVPVANLDQHALKDQHEVHGGDGPEGGTGLHHVNNLWNVTMIPKPMKMHKWFDDKAELKEGDVVYFRKVESKLSSKWTVGNVSDVVKSKDGVVEKCTVQNQNSSEDQPSYTDRAAKSWKEFEDYKQDVLPFEEDQLMLLLCAVNTDFIGLEIEPDASVDSSSSPELYGKGHSLGQSRRYYQVRIQSRLYSALNFLL